MKHFYYSMSWTEDFIVGYWDSAVVLEHAQTVFYSVLFPSSYCHFSIVRSHHDPLRPSSTWSQWFSVQLVCCFYVGKIGVAQKPETSIWGKQHRNEQISGIKFWNTQHPLPRTVWKMLMTWRHSLANWWPAVCWCQIFSTNQLIWFLCHVGPKNWAGNRLYHPMKRHWRGRVDPSRVESSPWKKSIWVFESGSKRLPNRIVITGNIVNERIYISTVMICISTHNSYQVWYTSVNNTLHNSSWVLRNFSYGK